VYLATGFTDMRKSINGLSLIVSEQFGQDPFGGSVFVFCNRSRDKLKIRWNSRIELLLIITEDMRLDTMDLEILGLC
jgi:transposase